MCLDRDGNIVACAGGSENGPGPMIYVFSPKGRVLGTCLVPGEPTNSPSATPISARCMSRPVMGGSIAVKVRLPRRIGEAARLGGPR